MNWKTYDYKHGRAKNFRIGKVIEGSIFKCAFCGGTGVLPNSKGTKCHVCRGKGEISINGPVVVCAYCKGMGNYPSKTNLTCPACKGKGLISITPPVDRCNVCRGLGRVPVETMPCRTCKGSGVVHNNDIIESEEEDNEDY